MMFAPDIEDAIKRFAEEEGVSREEALAALVRDWLVGNGYLRADEREEDGAGD
jgi:hypothetical protein